MDTKMAKTENVSVENNKKEEKKANMSKNEKNGNGNGHSDSDAEEAPLPTLTKAQKLELFATYKKAEDALTANEKQREALVKARSNAVQEIEAKLGSGPFLFGGRHMTISSRGDNYFFKGPKQVEVEKID